MASTSTRKPVLHLSVAGQSPSLSRLEYVLGNKHWRLDQSSPPPSASLVPSLSFTNSLPQPSPPLPTTTTGLLSSAPIFSPSDQDGSSSPYTSQSSASSPPPARLSPLPLGFPLTSQSSVYSDSEQEDEEDQVRLTPLHKRPLAEWSSTAGIRLVDQTTALTEGRELKRSNRNLIKDVVFELLEARCQIQDESEAHIIGTSLVTLVQHFFTETLEISPLSTTDLRSYITSYLDLLSPLAPPHPPPSSRQLHSAAPQRSDGSLLDIGYLLGGYSRTSLGGTGRNRLEEDELATGTRAPSTEMETRRVMGYLRDARRKASEAEMKIVDLEEWCERLQLTVDGYGRDWEERDMEAAGRTKYGSGSEAFGGFRSSEYVTRTEERSGSRYSLEEKGKQTTRPTGFHVNAEGSTSSYSRGSCPPVYHTSPPASGHQRRSFDDALPSLKHHDHLSPSPSSAPMNLHTTAHSSESSPKPQPSIASSSASRTVVERLLASPSLEVPFARPIPSSFPPSQSSSLIPRLSPPPFPCNSRSTSPPSLRPSSAHPTSSPPPPPSQLDWLSSSPSSPSKTIPSHLLRLQEPASPTPPPPVLPPNPRPTSSSSPSKSTSTLTFTPASTKVEPQFLYPLKSCLKRTAPPPSNDNNHSNEPPTTTTKPSPSSSSSHAVKTEPPSSSSSSKRRRNGMEPVFEHEPTRIEKPEGYKVPARWRAGAGGSWKRVRVNV
ncbi:hypothetical protein BDY24DRAFT_397631 [Mrakia frigida]|uniref:uncharacterized protein n=1 Tax=Mrakia frigida TaxID=29902 RepID=UPI003FCC190D